MRCELGKLGDLAPLSASLFGRGSQTGGAGRGGGVGARVRSKAPGRVVCVKLTRWW